MTDMRTISPHRPRMGVPIVPTPLPGRSPGEPLPMPDDPQPDQFPEPEPIPMPERSPIPMPMPNRVPVSALG